MVRFERSQGIQRPVRASGLGPFPCPKLGAVLAISQTASGEGEALDEHLKSTSTFVGPLHGIPVLLKDQAETEGLATTYGSIAATNSDNVPTDDGTVVHKLKLSGAVILGKTSMPGEPSWKEPARKHYANAAGRT